MPRHLLLLFCIFPMLLAAQIDPVAEAIKPNVVAITADFPSGNKEQGFGFVVGERNGILFLATAGHVVLEDGAAPGKEKATSIQVTFCVNDSSYTASFLKGTISPVDFGLLMLRKPIGYVWRADCLGTKPTVGTNVGYIGRKNNCYIPTATVWGTVNTLSRDFITIDILGVSRGTSGAPLIGRDGLLGMIVTAESVSADALTLEQLQNEVTFGGGHPYRFGLRLSNIAKINQEQDDDADWVKAKAINSQEACEQYLIKNPSGRHLQEANECIDSWRIKFTHEIKELGEISIEWRCYVENKQQLFQNKILNFNKTSINKDAALKATLVSSSLNDTLLIKMEETGIERILGSYETDIFYPKINSNGGLWKFELYVNGKLIGGHSIKYNIIP